MKLLLLRRWLSATSTISELFINPTDEGTRGFECYTLEDAYLGDETKVPGKSCIPCGDYHVELRARPKFKGEERPVIFTRKEGDLYIIESPLKKVRFVHCMLHEGNVPEETEGCPLVGQQRALDNSSIGYSRPALAELLQKVRAAIGRGESITCSIRLSTGRQFPQ